MKVCGAWVSASVLLAAGGVCNATVFRVDAAAGASGDGLSWETAFRDLADALAAASAGDEIWLKEGVHTPATADEWFVLKEGVSLYGGFAGTETSRDQRDASVHTTVVSADVGQDDIVGSGPLWYINWNRVTPNSEHVMTGANLTPATVIDGLVIADGDGGFGGGMSLVNASPTILSCTFRHNLAAFGWGGAIHLDNSSPVISDCSFIENYVHGGYGGGIADTGSSAPVVRDCVFRYNIAVAIGPDAGGAGIAHWAGSDVTVQRCIFDQNTARGFQPVGNYIGYGGGLFNWGAHMLVDRCVFTGNKATRGGGFISWGPSTLVNCLFDSNQAVPQPNDPYPELGGEGAAVAGSDAQASNTVMINCTVARNTGKKFAVYGGWNSTIIGVNSVIYSNVATHPEVVGGYREQIGGNFELAYSCVAKIFDPPAPGDDPIDPENLPGCIDDNPLFVNPAAGDLRLGAGSPCIDAADNAEVPAWVDLDLDGHERYFDDPATPNTGHGSPPLVDMGAYEFGAQVPSPCPGDVDGDNDVDSTDLNLVLTDFGCTSACPGDADGDGDADSTDLNIVLTAFGTACN